MMPRYPVYIPSKGRSDVCLTAKYLDRDGVPFKLVVEPQERAAYERGFGSGRVLVLPFSNLGQGSIPARNWIKDRSSEAGNARHWQLDDNLRGFYRAYKGKRLHCHAGTALRVVEDLADRYENVALAGMQYDMFYNERCTHAPFNVNHKVYSCTLVSNAVPNRWRGRYNEDTDLCLQVLSAGWCTLQVQAFLVKKQHTMTMRGGNTDELYQGDGRLKMARSLERMWPGIVQVKRRFQRPQHVINWDAFKTEPKLKPGIDLEELRRAGPDEYGMELRAVADVKSKKLRELLAEWQRTHPSDDQASSSDQG